ncbi:hypothetical protein [Oceanobacter mangrovi]|uniref:hypothetical protein n=1 Tax=Oceanobacter mangrovi TaxID=2862510 RepID=UPI001C8EF572|nr:hypothetical protein [Oceanobacter mangrovi]
MLITLIALIAGILLGGSATGLWLERRWRQQVLEAEKSLNEIAEQHHNEHQQNQQLLQKNADLTYQLNEARKTVNYLESRYQSPD